MQSHLRFLNKNHSLPFLMAIWNEFLCKPQNKFILGDRAILKKINPRRVYAESSVIFVKNHFSAIFDSHLKFLCKTQNRESSGTFS